jgi:hypothetical protein
MLISSPVMYGRGCPQKKGVTWKPKFRAEKAPAKGLTHRRVVEKVV